MLESVGKYWARRYLRVRDAIGFRYVTERYEGMEITWFSRLIA